MVESAMSTAGISHVIACCMGVMVVLAQEEAASCSQQPDETPLLQISRQQAVNDYYTQPMDDGPRLLRANAFREGTLRIRRPGVYKLVEDIVFQPEYDPAKMSWSLMPNDSKQYPLLGGYFLGFFAAIAIEADNVELDCGGHEIKMSKFFHKVQRFFSHIELCSAPFKGGEGPPQFGTLNRPDPPKCAVNVTVSNCRLGLSSHHSMHGNDNRGVRLRNLTMYDFEVAGVALNGASRVSMKKLRIGPSLAETFPAAFQSSIFMDHIVSTLMVQDPGLNRLLNEGEVTLRGKTQKVSCVFAHLREQLQQFVYSTKGPLLPLFGDGTQLPDGSAIYGILLHRSGLAIRDFGFCPDDTDKEIALVHDIHLEDIKIDDLRVQVDQVVKTFVDGKPALGMSDDVFQILLAWDPRNHKYVGNAYTDAQIAIGKLRHEAQERGISEDKIHFYWGSSHIPQKIWDWAARGIPWWPPLAFSEVSEDLTTELSFGYGGSNFTCGEDAMQHHSKGAVGMRLGFQKDIKVKDVVISNLYNQGTLNAARYCSTSGHYQGLDVRGVALSHIRNLHVFDVRQKGHFFSINTSRVFPITGLSDLQMRADDTSAEAVA